jgi:hypothetical protein
METILKGIAVALTLTIQSVAMLTTKPVVNKNMNQVMPTSLNDVPPGVYYVKTKHLMVANHLNYEQPLGGKFEVTCEGRNRPTLWDGGFSLAKIKHTDQSDMCSAIIIEEYKDAIQHTR